MLDQVVLKENHTKNLDWRFSDLIERLSHYYVNIPTNIYSGGNARSSVYSNEYRQDYENDSSTDEEPMEDNSSDEEEDFVSK